MHKFPENGFNAILGSYEPVSVLELRQSGADMYTGANIISCFMRTLPLLSSGYRFTA